MVNSGVVGGPVESDEEGPPPVVTAVLVALVEDIAVEEESISRFQFHMKQREYLHGEQTEVNCTMCVLLMYRQQVCDMSPYCTLVIAPLPRASNTQTQWEV